MVEEQEYTKHFDLTLWRKLLRFTVPYKSQLLALCGYMIVLASVDASIPLITRFAIDTYITQKSFSTFPYFCAGLIVAMLIQAVTVLVMIRTAGHIEMSVPNDIRKLAFRKLQELSLSYYNRTPVGWLMARMTSDIKNLGRAMSWNLVDFTWAIAMMLIMIVLMLSVNWYLALWVLAVVPFLVFVSMFFQKKILNNFRKARKLNSQITGAFNEGIMGAKTIKTLTREDECLNEFQELTDEMRNFSVRAATVSAVYTPIVILLGSLATGAVLWQGGIHVGYGDISFGTLVAFISYTTQFFNPVKDFARVFNDFQYAQASGERVLTMLDMDADIKDNDRVIQKYGTDKENWPEIHGDIAFRDVSFSYEDGEEILEDFNLDIKAGQMIALVGETGSGKTTMVNLICRFYEPVSGQICIDGVDYRERPLLWIYSQLGYVLQEPHLFSGTIRENITYGRPDATNEEIENAAKLVGAHDFILKLENGYDTQVGERGGRLSTGQKQLISFARAIITDPKLFILDEATSSVDTETEALIKAAIGRILKGRTSFIIAHRLSTIRSADRILVIENGKIIEDGKHHELLKKKGYYYNLYTNQFLQEKEMGLLCSEM